jgi:hypothetical protein
MRALSFISFCLSVWLIYGQNESPLSQPLVGITFALYDHPRPHIPGQGQTFVSYSITKSGVGWSQWVENGGAKSSHVRDTNAVEKAAQSVRLLESLAQPEHLPESSSQILTARWFEGDRVMEKKFPIDQVPSEVREVLLTMRCSEQDFKRLTFIRIPARNGTPRER